ncbi:translation initiation factor eIF-2B subunit beta isoform X2 [Helicoverpa zea]|uniref:translation initiation factor eIF-2B subunit beta isoform X1 n=1 Tax=Helicoverpa zea TaxID=7113 RepID=UPI001F569B89|nr:translation initiation factor eIF-2B subunit beta isoform X1 [Helicoverpa zea]XP_047039315.1 translation initiation factor eIF-2B subunit beta isoform X2 [Helicoverpa zea]XP_049704204.1 translation initiation factor eIF-2B subunit beta isoform X1 [Helicoverpa armigera]XP_049704205.1 translation initiation factor eIF-2B subunit beta isoform X2 [Helicoverpa armigera]XP_049704206.1 translation initiation factor eIF-2B subunit beta isoform X3 [Helicoverpa armigera]
MTPSKCPVKELDEKYVKLIGKFVSDIRNGKLRGTNNIALAMVTLLETIITDSQNATAFELCGTVRAVGRHVSSALPHELVAANVARRVLRAIRDENRAHANQSIEGSGESLQRLVLAAGSRRATLGAAQHDLREPLRDHIAELRGEIESSISSICSQAREHVHADELILTCGGSVVAERFLRAAAPRNYKLILATGPDTTQSHAMANRLSAAGVPVTVIGSEAIYAVMSRVNKVIISVKAALSGGAVFVAPGMHAVTQAAKHFSVPVLALAPLYKLYPGHGNYATMVNGLAAPHTAISYDRPETASANVHVFAPQYDFAPPDHVTLFITNLGGSSPSYMYRMVSELYDPNDNCL